MAIAGMIGGLVRRLCGDRGGNFGMMAAIVAPVLALATGYGINVGQMSLVRSNLLAALDSAVTSTARDLTTGAIAEQDAQAIVEAFLLANGARGFAAGDALSLDSIVVDRHAKTVSAEASVTFDIAFPLFGAANRQTVSVESAAIYSDKKIEIAMMLDVTGSMARRGRDDKLGDLQAAASNMVDLLLGAQNQRDPRIRISIVPYANSVNVGRDIARQAVFVEASARQRKAIIDADEMPGNADPDVVSAGGARLDNCATERKGRFRYTDVGPERSMVGRDFFLDGYAGRSRACPKAELVPLTADADRLLDVIDDFKAEGGTAGHIGIQWAWYMLSETWKNVLPAASAPARHDPEEVAKIAILMTDGEFNLSYFDISRASQAYNDSGKRETREAATTLCRKMREAGIEVFTIGFKLDDRKAKETMSACATPDTGSVRHYFDTADGEELNAAFIEIARNVEALALMK